MPPQKISYFKNYFVFLLKKFQSKNLKKKPNWKCVKEILNYRNSTFNIQLSMNDKETLIYSLLNYFDEKWMQHKKMRVKNFERIKNLKESEREYAVSFSDPLKSAELWWIFIAFIPSHFSSALVCGCSSWSLYSSKDIDLKIFSLHHHQIDNWSVP